eukprot:scaffold57991_cov45-Phaeocystis_antarctica.AAC.2
MRAGVSRLLRRSSGLRSHASSGDVVVGLDASSVRVRRSRSGVTTCENNIVRTFTKYIRWLPSLQAFL